MRENPTPLRRQAARTTIDDAISAWTTSRTSRETFETRQAEGVPAMAVMTNKTLATDPHLDARGVSVDLEHPELGRTRVMQAPWLCSDLQCILRPGPLFGQDNDEVLETVLGLSQAERTKLAEVHT